MEVGVASDLGVAVVAVQVLVVVDSATAEGHLLLDLGHTLMKGAANLTWDRRCPMLIVLEMTNLQAKTLNHCL